MDIAALPAFVALAGAMVAVALVFVLPALRTGRRGAGAPAQASVHIDTARAQLADLDAERASGAMSPDTYREARAAIERSLLRELPEPQDARAAPRLVHIALALAFPLVAAALYLALGEPRVLHRDSRPDQPTAAALAQHVRDHPRDARGWVMLARTLAAQGEFAQAASAFERAVAFANVARDPAVWTEYADALGMAQGATLEGKPLALIDKALALDPAHPQALEMAGSAAYARGDFAGAARRWRMLLAQLPAGDPHAQELAAAIARSDRLARTTLPRADALAGNAIRR